jgi:hypothetical protein
VKFTQSMLLGLGGKLGLQGQLILTCVMRIAVEVGGHDAFLLKDFLSFGDHSFLALERFELIEYVS